MTRTADVVIVGGGVTGVSIAYHLAGHGVGRVLVLERKFLASGGTGRSVGIVRQLYPTPETSAMVLRALSVFQRFGDAVGGDAGYVACGVLIGVSPAMRPKLEANLAMQRGLGIRAEILEPADVARVEPAIDPAGLGGVLWEPDSGYGDPTGVTLAYADAARRRGVTIEQGVEVTAVRVLGDHVRGVETAAGDTIDAPVVVNAAGLWSPRLAQLAGVTLPIIVGRHPVFIVERDAAAPAHRVYLDLAGGSYVRPETGHLTLTGSLTDDETEHPMDPELLGAETGLDEASPVLERTGRAVPRLSEARYRRGYAGAFDITPDWMPILDHTGPAGFYTAAGMSGHGFKLSPAVGEMMAALITGATPPVSLDPFRLDRFATAGAGGTFVASYLR
ncbi:MAG: FAD-binding oxidoreductase [Candidatus Rokubacteria bacterium]|nr:FAD-binding oxidoreductase [Candidatus Rokubacteria bacterium]